MKPLPVLNALPYFAIPSALMALALFVTVPLLDSLGAPLVWNAAGHFCVILGGLGVAAVTLASRELLPGQSLWARLRLRPLRITDLALGLAVGFAGLFAYLQLTPVMREILGIWPWSYPDWMARFMTPTHFLDVPLAGAWWLLGVYGVIYLCNVAGEELWWRGYLQPRQELALGRWAWIPHGLMWAGFHAFFAWDIVLLLPIALMLSAACQWRKSAWPGMISHGVLNALGIVNLAGAIAAA
jgi:membrane protease YdiL (CAAX protease family)